MSETPATEKQKPRSVMLDEETWARLKKIAKAELDSPSRSQAIRYLARKHDEKKESR